MVPLNQLHKLLWSTVLDTFETNCIGYAKEAAYSLILSFFPMLLFATALFAIFGRDYSHEIMSTLQRVLPPDSRALVAGYLEDFFKNQPPAGLLWVAALATIFPAAGLMSTFSQAFDHIYDNTQRRSFWEDQLMVYVMVFVVGAPLLVATVATAGGTHFEHAITHWMGNKKIFGIAWVIGRWFIVWLTVMMIAMLLYRIGPSRTPAWRHVIPGAVLASTLWILLTLGFGAYVAHFTSYNRIYGSLGAGIILLVWMFFTSLVLMIGAVFNRQCEIQLSPLATSEAKTPKSKRPKKENSQNEKAKKPKGEKAKK